MVFSNLVFLCLFLPLTIILYYLSPKAIKNYFLLFASLLFYSWGEPQYIILMIFSILMNYLFGLLIEKFREDKVMKSLFILFAVIGNILLLGYFKYSTFLIETLNDVLNTSINVEELPLPIGISFYTFQALSYIIDVSRTKGIVQKNPFNLALYISLFPQLVAGPIVRYDLIANEINNRTHSTDLFLEGIRDFTIGLAKKVIIANQLAIIADSIFNRSTDDISGSLAWLGVIAYSLQLYFDFSGYSDMAVGLGKMFGFNFPKNFDYPYISKSIAEFWRRWHMTLGSWFRDYIYIPLGGNRVSKWKIYRNLFVVWFLTGLWHGADWNFIAWGLYYGVIIAAERAFLGKFLKRIPKLFQHIYVILLFMIGWVFFRSSNFTYAYEYIAIMFGFIGNNPFWSNEIVYFFKQYWIEIFIAFIAATPIVKNLTSNINANFKVIAGPVFYFLLLGYCLTSLVTSSYNPFIYFRF